MPDTIPLAESIADAPVAAAVPTGGAARGVRWSTVATVGRQAIRLVTATVLARLIGPDAFGVVAQATIYVALIQLLTATAFNAALVQTEELDDVVVGSVFCLDLLLAATLALSTLLVAGPAARFFGTPDLRLVLIALSASVVIEGVEGVPAALLMRSLRFRALAAAEIGGAFVGMLVGIVAALRGGSYWSVVAQTLVGDLVTVAVLLTVVGRFAARPSIDGIRRVWPFSANVLGFQGLVFAMRNVDNLVVGRVLGASALASYSLSYRVMMLPIQNLGQVINRVAFPVYSRLQDDTPRLQASFRRSSRLVAAAATPVMTLIVLNAPTLVDVVLGPEWEPAVLPMQLLAIAGLRQSVQVLIDPVLFGLGRADWQLRWALAWSASCVIAFAIGVRWGLAGVAGAYVVADLLVSPVIIWLVCQLLHMRRRDYVRDFVPFLGAVLPMTATWLVVHAATQAWTGSVSAAAMASVGGLAAYAAAVWVVAPDVFAEVRSTGFKLLRGA